MELSGSGETVFDLKAGVPQKVTFSGKFIMRENAQVAEVPVTLRCELVAEGTAAAATSIPAAAPPATAKTPESDKARLDGFLADLRAVDKDWTKCFQALEGLRTMKPDDARREEVAEVLDAYLAEKNYSARASALRVAQQWGTRHNVPALLRLLEPSEPDTVRRRAIDILGSLGDPRAAALAGRVKDATDRAAATRALRALGREAEEAAIALLADSDPDVRKEACKLLADIGGEKSIAALQQPSVKDDPAAKAALEKLKTTVKK